MSFLGTIGFIKKLILIASDMVQDPKNAFLAAYDEHAEALYRHCYFRVYSPELAEELVQETYMKTWQYLAAGNEVENIKAFLYRVATNLVIDHHRKKKEESLEGLLDAEVIREPGYDGHHAIENRVLVSEIRNVFEKLSEDKRNLLVLRYVDDLDPKEIAEILGTNANNISVKLHNAVKKVRGFVK